MEALLCLYCKAAKVEASKGTESEMHLEGLSLGSSLDFPNKYFEKQGALSSCH